MADRLILQYLVKLIENRNSDNQTIMSKQQSSLSGVVYIKLISKTIQNSTKTIIYVMTVFFTLEHSILAK